MLLEMKVYNCKFTSSALFLTNFSVGGWLCYKLISLYPFGNESACWGLKGKLYFHLLVTQVLKQLHLLTLKKICFCILQAACQLQQHSSFAFFLLTVFKHCQYLDWGGDEKSLDIITSTLLVVSHCCFHLSLFEYQESALAKDFYACI